jgi:hypothetical protein
VASSSIFNLILSQRQTMHSGWLNDTGYVDNIYWTSRSFHSRSSINKYRCSLWFEATRLFSPYLLDLVIKCLTRLW